MKIKQGVDNGNLEVINRSDAIPNLNWASNRNHSNNIYDNSNSQNSDTFNYINNSNNIHNNVINSSNNTTKESRNINNTTELIYNKQYKINIERNNINTNFTNNQFHPVNLEASIETAFTSCESINQGNIDETPQTTPSVEERAFDQSDTEISEKGTSRTSRVPRGIVNPNYPGFQHYAHTLQDYSSNIENFYHSENEMTDDDIDVEIVDSTFEVNTNETVPQTDDVNANYNENGNFTNIDRNEHMFTNINHTVNECKVDNNVIPDLLKNVANINNNNDDSLYYELNCTDTDIENNFNAKDIIGDFNKEIEDEIKQLFNYSINIEDDLEELRKDIKDTLGKPIENTINNISEVVNHVIKKLVETKSDQLEEKIQKPEDDISFTKKIEVENELNLKKELNMSRPTFLVIDTNSPNNVIDAFLSNGRDEIKFEEYDTEKICTDVENTIKQLSTELRKIIPKLDEMRERDKVFLDNKNEPTDRNLNNIPYTPDARKTSSILRFQTIAHIKENIPTNLQGDALNRKGKAKIAPPRDRGNGNTDTSKTPKSNVKNCSSDRSNGSSQESDLENFDVYNIETAMPFLDIDAIENHLKAAKKAEIRKRNDREEIRRRLAMGSDHDEYYSIGHTDRPGKKPSLHSRMQSGKNLQICFMNETASDNESQASDIEKNSNGSNKTLLRSSIFSKSNYSLNNHPYQTRPLSVNITKHDRNSNAGSKFRPPALTNKTPKSRSSHSLGHIETKETDFFALQATLQTEARMALAQAKEMARLQMERERRGRAESPVRGMLRRSLEKAHAPLAADRRRVSRHLLTDMNVAQLQVIVNELHSQIESLNDNLVTLLMARDELHMGQDSMLVDIEDLTRYLGVKEQTKKTKGNSKFAMKRLTSLVHK